MNNKKPRILMVTEKYCDGKPECGLTNNYHNLFGSLKHSMPEVVFDVVHLDEAVVNFGTHMDVILPRVCEQLKPDIVVFSLLGKSPANPNIHTFEKLKKMGIYNLVMWPDVGIDWGYPQVQQLGNLIDLHVGWDNADSEFHRTRQLPPNFQQMWVPQDDKLYFRAEPQDIPISFIGSVRYQERQVYLKHALTAGAQILIRGGQREEKLSPEQYANLIRRSKISINFPFCPGGFDQCKGRVFEVLACQSMLLERKNAATSKLFTPGVDYVEFADPNDFVAKIKHYLNNDAERAKIAEAGYKKFHEKYSAKKFWEAILERYNNDRRVSVHASDKSSKLAKDV